MSYNFEEKYKEYSSWYKTSVMDPLVEKNICYRWYLFCEGLTAGTEFPLKSFLMELTKTEADSFYNAVVSGESPITPIGIDFNVVFDARKNIVKLMEQPSNV